MNTDPGTAAAPVPGSDDPQGPIGEWLENLKTSGLVVDHDGIIVAANGEARTILRRRSAEVIGQDAHDLLHRDSHGHPLPRSGCRLREALLTGRTRHSDGEWFARGDGTLLQLAWLITPCSVSPGAPGALVLLYDLKQGDPRPPTVAATTALTELERLTLLAETTTQLTSTLDVDEALHRLAALAVPRLADWAVVDLITEARRGAALRWSCPTKDGVLLERLDLEGPMPPVPEESPDAAVPGPARRRIQLADPSTYQGPPDSGIAVEQRRLFTETGMHSAAIAPIRGLRDVLGALTLGRSRAAAQPSRAAISRCSRTSPGARVWPWTTPASTSVSARSPRPCSATCCPSCPGARTGDDRAVPARTARLLGRRRLVRRLRSGRRRPRHWPSVTSSVTTLTPPPAWPRSATCCVPSPGPSTSHPATSSPGSTTP